MPSREFLICSTFGFLSIRPTMFVLCGGFRRDITERGRTFERTLDQYERTIRPMHFEFVEPSKRHADIIIPEGAQTGVSVEFLCSMVREKLASEEAG